MLVNISKVTGMVSMLVAENHVFERIKDNVNDVDYPNNKKFRTNLILHNYNANGFFVFEVWTTYKGVVL